MALLLCVHTVLPKDPNLITSTQVSRPCNSSPGESDIPDFLGHSCEYMLTHTYITKINKSKSLKKKTKEKKEKKPAFVLSMVPNAYSPNGG